MWKRFTSPFALILALALVLTSVVSAGMMAPDRQSAAREAFELAHGPIHGLCGDGEGGQDHRCPLCHSPPEGPVTAHAGRLFLLIAHDGWRQRDDLPRRAQTRDRSHSPRAPPAMA